ncbi:MAG: cation diffusion facilitator family transporter [Thermoleophilaceae bacterium]
MTHEHPHRHAREADHRRIAAALALNVLLLVAGLAGGIVFHSLALLADAGHVLADVAALALALAAGLMAMRPASPRRTFGRGRGEILAALVNGATLVVVAVLVFVAAIARLSDPPDVTGGGVLALGAFALVGNGVAAWLLHGGDRTNINLEAALRHTAADALGALGVIAAGAIVLATGWDYADPIVSIAIGLLILLGSWRLIREPLDVLMEAAPADIDVQAVGRAMVAVPGVREVHDLHVWTVTSGFPALAAHVRSEPGDDPDDVRERLEAVLHERFGLDHTTLQVVTEPLLQLEDRRADPPTEGAGPPAGAPA